ncbi:methionine aminopeptidase 2 isoform X2 [Prionailurus iriomotensis]
MKDCVVFHSYSSRRGCPSTYGDEPAKETEEAFIIREGKGKQRFTEGVINRRVLLGSQNN